MIIIRSSLRSAYHNLKCENEIIQNPDFKSEPVLLFYRNDPALILGKYQLKNEEIFEHKNPPRVYHRLSGGGSVVHTRGILNYSLILPLDLYPSFFDIEKSYEKILGKFIEKFQTMNRFKRKVKLYRQGISDLCLLHKDQYRKISGNSQARKNGRLLHHGTFIFDLPPLSFFYLLKQPIRQPKYRMNKNHKNFMVPFSPIKNHEIIRKIITQSISEMLNSEIRDLSRIFHYCKFHSTVHRSPLFR